MVGALQAYCAGGVSVIVSAIVGLLLVGAYQQFYQHVNSNAFELQGKDHCMLPAQRHQHVNGKALWMCKASSVASCLSNDTNLKRIAADIAGCTVLWSPLQRPSLF